MQDTGASLLVTDYAPLRLGRQWREAVAGKLEVPFHEVDAHNVVPVWVASGERACDADANRPHWKQQYQGSRYWVPRRFRFPAA